MTRMQKRRDSGVKGKVLNDEGKQFAFQNGKKQLIEDSLEIRGKES